MANPKKFVEQVHRYAFAFESALQVIGGRDARPATNANLDYQSTADGKNQVIQIFGYFKEVLEGELAHGNMIALWPKEEAISVAKVKNPFDGLTQNISMVMANTMVSYALNIAATLVSTPNSFSLAGLFLERGQIDQGGKKRLVRMSEMPGGVQVLYKELLEALHMDNTIFTLCRVLLKDRISANRAADSTLTADFFDGTEIDKRITASQKCLALLENISTKELFLQKFFNKLAAVDMSTITDREPTEKTILDLKFPGLKGDDDVATVIKKIRVLVKDISAIDWSIDETTAATSFSTKMGDLIDYKDAWLNDGHTTGIERLFNKYIEENSLECIENLTLHFDDVRTKNPTAAKSTAITAKNVADLYVKNVRSPLAIAFRMAVTLAYSEVSKAPRIGGGGGTAGAAFDPRKYFDAKNPITPEQFAEFAIIYGKFGSAEPFSTVDQALWDGHLKTFVDYLGFFFDPKTKKGLPDFTDTNNPIAFTQLSGLIYIGRWLLSHIRSPAKGKTDPLDLKTAEGVVKKSYSVIAGEIKKAVSANFSSNNTEVEALAQKDVIQLNNGKTTRRAHFLDVIAAPILSTLAAKNADSFMTLEKEFIHPPDLNGNVKAGGKTYNQAIDSGDYVFLSDEYFGVVLVAFLWDPLTTLGATPILALLDQKRTGSVDFSKIKGALAELPSNTRPKDVEDVYSWGNDSQDLDLQSILSNGNNNNNKPAKSTFGW